MNRVRLFAHPGNPDANAAAVAASARRAARAKAAQRLPLRKGSVVPSGTVLGKVWTSHGGHAGHLRFAIKPCRRQRLHRPGADAGQLGTAAEGAAPAGRPRGRTRCSARPRATCSCSRARRLERTVLSDPGITIAGCARQDVASGAVDHRVLAVLAFLSRSGLKPTVGALRCGQSQYTSSGATSPHYRGDAVDITAINGVPLTHHQGPGTITDLTIRALLTLPSEFVPHEILSLMHYPASPADEGGVLALEPRRARLRQRPTAQLLAAPTPGSVAHSAAKGKAAPAPVVSTSVLSSLQWSQLVTRIGAIPAPKIVHKPSSSAIADPKPRSSRAGAPHRARRLRSWPRGELRRHRPGRHEDPGGRRGRAPRGARLLAAPDAHERRTRGRRAGDGARRCARPQRQAGIEPAELSGHRRRLPGRRRARHRHERAQPAGLGRHVPARGTARRSCSAPPVELGNDVQVATVAESELGAGRAFDSLLGVFWGTGVGGCAGARTASRGAGAAAPARSATWSSSSTARAARAGGAAAWRPTRGARRWKSACASSSRRARRPTSSSS